MIETSTFYDRQILNQSQEKQREEINELKNEILRLQEEMKILKQSHTRVYDL